MTHIMWWTIFIVACCTACLSQFKLMTCPKTNKALISWLILDIISFIVLMTTTFVGNLE